MGTFNSVFEPLQRQFCFWTKIQLWDYKVIFLFYATQFSKITSCTCCIKSYVWCCPKIGSTTKIPARLFQIGIMLWMEHAFQHLIRIQVVGREKLAPWYQIQDGGSLSSNITIKQNIVENTSIQICQDRIGECITKVECWYDPNIKTTSKCV